MEREDEHGSLGLPIGRTICEKADSGLEACGHQPCMALFLSSFCEWYCPSLLASVSLLGSISQSGPFWRLALSSVLSVEPWLMLEYGWEEEHGFKVKENLIAMFLVQSRYCGTRNDSEDVGKGCLAGAR